MVTFPFDVSPAEAYAAIAQKATKNHEPFHTNCPKHRMTLLCTFGKNVTTFIGFLRLSILTFQRSPTGQLNVHCRRLQTAKAFHIPFLVHHSFPFATD
jgi:hypothetical protein